VQHRELCEPHGIYEGLPKFLYPLGGRNLAQIALENSMLVGSALGVEIPNIVMTNSEIAERMVTIFRASASGWTQEQRRNTLMFNQVVMPRIWVEDGVVENSQLFPAGHGDFPYLMAQLNLAEALKAAGVEFVVFSNGDEFMWGPDPVLIDVARELKEQGYGMLSVVVPNTNNQKGGGAVKDAAGRQMLVETPRLPWEIMASGQAPLGLNTTFYILSVDHLVAAKQALMNVPKSLDVKTMPRGGRTEQVIGVDSWAGDVFSALLNPRFLWWERLNFLGVKTPDHVIGSSPVGFLGGRTYAGYLRESAEKYGRVMRGLIEGNLSIAAQLVANGYQYVEVSE
jgi:UDP-N-acetylglucosamine pyrophosphorylase